MSALKYADFFGKMKPQLKLFGKEILEKYNTFMFLKSEPRDFLFFDNSRLNLSQLAVQKINVTILVS